MLSCDAVSYLITMLCALSQNHKHTGTLLSCFLPSTSTFLRMKPVVLAILKELERNGGNHGEAIKVVETLTLNARVQSKSKMRWLANFLSTERKNTLSPWHYENGWPIKKIKEMKAEHGPRLLKEFYDVDISRT